jgi:hypothetical protein
MGKGSQRITASGDSENNGLGSRKAHNVSRGPQEDCGVSAGKVGESKSSAKEGCLDRTSHLTLTDTNESPTVD